MAVADERELTAPGVSEFAPDEAAQLARYFTNLDRGVFALRNLPEVVKGALFSRYSRTEKSLRRVLLEEFLREPEFGVEQLLAEPTAGDQVATRKAEEFYERVLVGYGDDSVAELAGAHLAVEGVSTLAAKALQDSRIGLSPLEKSTRYVRFDRRDDGGRFAYYRSPVQTTSSRPSPTSSRSSSRAPGPVSRWSPARPSGRGSRRPAPRPWTRSGDCCRRPR